MRPITPKIVQQHWTCVCGKGIVDQITLDVPYRDFQKWEIKRKKDKKTGLPFLTMKTHSDECECNNNCDWDYD